MIAIQTSARNGRVVAAKLVDPDDQIMLITTGGVLIRMRVGEIREMSRATQGVTLINLGADEKLAGLEKIADRDDQDLANGEEAFDGETAAGAEEEATGEQDAGAAGGPKDEPGNE
jgi:DNA gyrase subunit A